MVADKLEPNIVHADPFHNRFEEARRFANCMNAILVMEFQKEVTRSFRLKRIKV